MKNRLSDRRLKAYGPDRHTPITNRSQMTNAENSLWGSAESVIQNVFEPPRFSPTLLHAEHVQKIAIKDRCRFLTRPNVRHFWTVYHCRKSAVDVQPPCLVESAAWSSESGNANQKQLGGRGVNAVRRTCSVQHAKRVISSFQHRHHHRATEVLNC